MNFFDLRPNYINPYFLSRLDGNIDSAIMLKSIEGILADSADDDEFIFIDFEILKEMTGLSNNMIKKCTGFLKKRNLIQTKIKNHDRFYKLNYSEYVKLTGFEIKPSVIEKLNHNAKAAFLLSYFVDFNNTNKVGLYTEIPSKEIEFLTGLNRKAQIYARDSLLGFKLLSTFILRRKKQYKLNYENCNRFFQNKIH